MVRVAIAASVASVAVAAADRGQGVATAHRLVRAGEGRSATKAAESGIGTRVVIELFQVGLVEPSSLRYVRRIAVLDGRDPDVVVAELLQGQPKVGRFFVDSPAILHSTSWRYEKDGTVVLTYLAYGEQPNPSFPDGNQVQTMAQKDLPGIGTTDPDRPRPPVLAHQDVLAHGLRHLALLARRAGGERFGKRLGERSRDFFSSLEPELAGQIGGSNLTVPSPTGAR